MWGGEIRNSKYLRDVIYGRPLQASNLENNFEPFHVWFEFFLLCFDALLYWRRWCLSCCCCCCCCCRRCCCCLFCCVTWRKNKLFERQNVLQSHEPYLLTLDKLHLSGLFWRVNPITVVYLFRTNFFIVLCPEIQT